jgi:NADH-quinone oxidoreductase subunit M
VLVFEAAALAAFSARDLLLFFVSTEVMALAAAALVGVWGRHRRVYSAIRLLFLHLVGSSLMLVALLWIAWRHQVATGFWTFALPDLVALDLPVGVQVWLWPAFVLALAIRAPVLPLHTWWPDALSQAPAPAGALLASVLTTAGGYGLCRIVWPLFPGASSLWAPWLALIAVVGVVHGAVVAMAQSDLRRVVAYLSMSHVGIIVLGLCALTPQGVQGAAMQLIARGLWTGGMLLVVAMLAGRRGTTDIDEFGGLRHVVPGLSAMMLLMAMAAMGLPGTVAFPGVAAGLNGAVESPTLTYGRELGIAAIAGVLLWTVAMLRTVLRVVAGPLARDRNRGLRDLTRGEWLILLPVGALIVTLGLWPTPLLALIEPAVRDVLVGIVDRTAVAAP